MKMKKIWIAAVLLLATCSGVRGQEEQNKDRLLREVESPVVKIVKKHFPKVQVTYKGQALHLESSVKVHEEWTLIKSPFGNKPSKEKVIGPRKEGGVWCDIELKRGDKRIEPRQEGRIVLNHFAENTVYQELTGTGCYLHITLRVPKSERESLFEKEFKKTIRSLVHSFSTDR